MIEEVDQQATEVIEPSREQDAAAPCKDSPISQWRKRARRARTLRGAITVASVVVAVGGVVAGIVGGVVAAANSTRKKK